MRRQKVLTAAGGFGAAVFFFLACAAPCGAGEISIENVAAARETADRYAVTATVHNAGEATREVFLRAQLAFYDRSSPRGDLPEMILRKDAIEILKGGETRSLHFTLFEEGVRPRGAFRREPSVRIRRERVWHY